MVVGQLRGEHVNRPQPADEKSVINPSEKAVSGPGQMEGCHMRK